MKLSSNISQNVRVFVAAAGIAVGAMGCGGSSDNPGTTSTACSLADVNKILITTTSNLTTGCTVIGSCHDNAGSAAGLDLTSVGWQTKLVGKSPSTAVGAATTKTMCAGPGDNYVYLKAGSNPAEGLFIDKIKPGATAPCGVHMPNFGVELSATQFACIQSYLTTITSP
jgi:hypothetical protein